MKVTVKWDKGRQRWRVEHSIPLGNRKYERRRAWRDKEDEAQAFATTIRERFRAFGASGMQADPAELAEVKRLESKCAEHGLTLAEAVEIARQARTKTRAPEFDEAVALLLAEKRRIGVRRQSELNLECAMRRFGDFIGRIPIEAITSDQVAAFVTSQATTKESRRTMRAAVANLFNFAIARGWVLKNPAKAVVLAKMERGDVTVAHVEDVERYLRVAWEAAPELVPSLALRFLLGLRWMSIGRLDWSEIRMDEGVTLRASKLKTARRVYLEGMPPVLWQWLTPFAQKSGRVARSHYPHYASELAAFAGVTFARNAPRHTFASAHVAAYRNAGDTAALMAHHGEPRVLFDFYVGMMTKADGLRYFANTPPPPATIGQRADEFARFVRERAVAAASRRKAGAKISRLAGGRTRAE